MNLHLSSSYSRLAFVLSCGYLSLSKDLGLLTLLQARSKAGHNVFLCTDHLHNLLVTLHAHSL